jgi:predicted CxxxxCH...CXXCH cytochrome family protein
VGVHQAHVRGGTLGVAVACSGCHPVPTDVLTPGHADGTVNVTFGPLGSQSLSNASYDRATQTCSNVYCHGSFQGGNGANAPRWSYPSAADSAAAVACGTCHALPPPAPAHPATGTADCGGCHPGFRVDSANPSVHINGRIDRQ